MTEDDDLVEEILRGSPESVETLRSWIRSAFAPYRRRFASEFEDLEQEILLDLTHAMRAGRFRGASMLRTYVRSCVHHKCIDRIRAARRRQWISIEDVDLPLQTPSAFDQLAANESIARVLSIADGMSEACRELWRMLERGMSYSEMSRELGISEGALRVRVLRCRKRARAALAELGDEYPMFSTQKTDPHR